MTIIRIKPVVPRLQRESSPHSNRFVAGARDLEKNLLLALEQDLAVVDSPRGKHDAIRIDQLLTGEPLIGLALSRVALVQLGIDFGCAHVEEFQPRIIVNEVSGVRSGSKENLCLRKIFSTWNQSFVLNFWH